MSVVTGNFKDIGIAAVRMPVTFKQVGAPVIVGASLIAPGSKVAITDELGNLSYNGGVGIRLAWGTYEMSIDDGEGGLLKLRINVPNDSGTYNFIDLLSDDAYTPTSPPLGNLLDDGTLDRMKSFSNLVKDAGDNPISADVIWPDGSSGVYTALVVGTFVDSYQITHDASGSTVTQPLITRDADGYAITRPARVLS